LKGCKHMDRCQNRCSEPLRIRGHKRGHLTVECAAGHQWVWCPLCCNCGTKGCNQTTHWIERDCYDTGKRNHMQRHSNQTTAETREAVVDPEASRVRCLPTIKVALQDAHVYGRHTKRKRDEGALTLPCLKWASTDRFPTTDTESSSSSCPSPVSTISREDSGITMDCDDRSSSRSCSPTMKRAVPSSMLTWSALIPNPTSSSPSSSVSSFASTKSCITISRADRDSTVRPCDDCLTACCASVSFRWRSEASARDQTGVGCDALWAEAEGMDTADLSAVDTLLQLQTRC